MVRLTAGEIESQLKGLSDWKFGQNALSKQFPFPDFRSAIRFVNAVSEAVGPTGHHPDILISSGRVSVTLWTREAGGVTQRDIDLAVAIEDMARKQGA